MKIKIGSLVYDSEEQPIMVVLSEQDKGNIAQMRLGIDAYLSMPSNQNWTDTEIATWMETDNITRGVDSHTHIPDSVIDHNEAHDTRPSDEDTL